MREPEGGVDLEPAFRVSEVPLERAREALTPAGRREPAPLPGEDRDVVVEPALRDELVGTLADQRARAQREQDEQDAYHTRRSEHEPGARRPVEGAGDAEADGDERRDEL